MAFKHYFFLLLIVTLLKSCLSQKSDGTIDKKLLYGKWCLLNKDQLNYPKIIFQKNSIAILTSKMDTVYTHKYYLKNKELIFFMDEANINSNKILSLEKDTLRLKTLLLNKFEQVYYKCDNN